MRIRKTIINVSLLLVGFSYGQDLPRIVPPSPEGSALAKFVDSPVSYHTGTPDISIPLVTVSSGNIQVPVSISYHAKGIQVSEIASRVGLGWTLMAGGAITRQMRYLPDEATGGWINENFTQTFLTSHDTRDYVFAKHSGDEIDLEPDLFFFNFLGISGKFIIDQKDDTPLVQTTQDLKIEFKRGNDGSGFITNWIVIDASGNKYYFGTANDKSGGVVLRRNNNNSVGDEHLGNGSTGQLINTWYLDRIESPENHIVYFEYEKEGLRLYPRRGDGGYATTAYCDYSDVYMYQSQLKKIITPEQTVYFDADSVEREDLVHDTIANANARALKKVRLVNKWGTHVKSFELEHEYSASTLDLWPLTTNVNPILAFLDQPATKRLFLKRIIEKDTLSHSLPYNFYYNQTVLPSRHSNSIDNWGYYNGAPNGDFLYSLQTKNRRVNVNLSEAGILKKIVYPTGGFTEFFYEQNQTRTPTAFSNISYPPNNPIDSGMWPFFSAPANSTTGVPFTNGAYTKTFTLAKTTTVKANVSFIDTDIECPELTGAPGCNYTILMTAPGQLTKVLYRGLQDIAILANVTYTITAIPKNIQNHNPENHEQSITISLIWNYEVVDSSEELLGPGKRIKKIVKGDNNNPSLLTTEYSYVDDFNKSTGMLFSFPGFFHKISYINSEMHVGAKLDSNTPLSSYSNGSLGYSLVTEKVVGNENIGKTVYKFTNFSDTGDFYVFPYHVPNDMEWVRGKLLETTFYSFTNNAYRPEQSVTTNYVYYNNSTSAVPNFNDLENPDPVDPDATGYLATLRKIRVPLFKFGAYKYSISDYDNVSDNSDSYRTAYFYGGRADISKTVEKHFYYNDSNVLDNTITKTQTFVHDAIFHNQLTKQTITNSLGETIETKYCYPKDTGAASLPHSQDLFDAHRYSTLLKTEVTKSGNTLSTTVNNFDFAGSILAPENIQSSKGGGTLETKVKFNKYDTSGNILEVQKENGMKISYIWGYNNSKPVAKIENIAYASIPTGIISAIQNASNIKTFETSLVTPLDNLRNDPALTNAMVTTYIYNQFGVTSIKDPKGDSFTYTYDGFGRLQSVRDRDGNIISEQEYHYRTPVAP